MKLRGDLSDEMGIRMRQLSTVSGYNFIIWSVNPLTIEYEDPKKLGINLLYTWPIIIYKRSSP